MIDEITRIKNRNRKVELDKEWETSLFRRSCIALMTYVIAMIFLWTIGVSHYWLNALVPTGGYVLSTLSLPWLKKWWMKYRYRY